MARRARCTVQRDDERFAPILSTMRLSADMCPVSSPRPSNDSARPSERDIEEAGMRTAASRRDGYQLLSPDGVRQRFDLRMLPLTCLPARNGPQIRHQRWCLPHPIPVLPPNFRRTLTCLAARSFAYFNHGTGQVVPQTTNNTAPRPTRRYLLGDSKSSGMLLGRTERVECQGTLRQVNARGSGLCSRGEDQGKAYQGQEVS